MWHVAARIILTKGARKKAKGKGKIRVRGGGVEVDGALPLHQALLRASHYACIPQTPVGR